MPDSSSFDHLNGQIEIAGGTPIFNTLAEQRNYTQLTAAYDAEAKKAANGSAFDQARFKFFGDSKPDDDLPYKKAKTGTVWSSEEIAEHQAQLTEHFEKFVSDARQKITTMLEENPGAIITGTSFKKDEAGNAVLVIEGVNPNPVADRKGFFEYPDTIALEDDNEDAVYMRPWGTI